MRLQKSDYEQLLAEYSDRSGVIELLKQYRPYLEMLPSMRRPQASILTIPLPVVRIHRPVNGRHNCETMPVILPCDIAVLMCDPEWQIKLDGDILIFIHRPEEDFSDLLNRWRQSQVWLEQEYEWIMPLDHQHIYSEMSKRVYPLFIIFPATPPRIRKGLDGAGLPYITQAVASTGEDQGEDILISEY